MVFLSPRCCELIAKMTSNVVSLLTQTFGRATISTVTKTRFRCEHGGAQRGRAHAAPQQLRGVRCAVSSMLSFAASWRSWY
jgi:hypothetical protein